MRSFWRSFSKFLLASSLVVVTTSLVSGRVMALLALSAEAFSYKLVKLIELVGLIELVKLIKIVGLIELVKCCITEVKYLIEAIRCCIMC